MRSREEEKCQFIINLIRVRRFSFSVKSKKQTPCYINDLDDKKKKKFVYTYLVLFYIEQG